MGKLIVHDWARLMALTSATYVVWAATWGVVYRKYFWDMIGAELGPAGLVPASSAGSFVTLIVDMPVVQAVNIVNGLFTLVLEWPLAPTRIRKLKFFQSAWCRVALYTWSAFCALLVYQTIDAGVFFSMTAGMYALAAWKGETMQHGAAASRAVLPP